jgi:hypothetical protein
MTFGLVHKVGFKRFICLGGMLGYCVLARSCGWEKEPEQATA